MVLRLYIEFTSYSLSSPTLDRGNRNLHFWLLYEHVGEFTSQWISRHSQHRVNNTTKQEFHPSTKQFVCQSSGKQNSMMDFLLWVAAGNSRHGVDSECEVATTPQYSTAALSVGNEHGVM
jgi:hypothetical protein